MKNVKTVVLVWGRVSSEEEFQLYSELLLSNVAVLSKKQSLENERAVTNVAFTLYKKKKYYPKKEEDNNNQVKLKDIMVSSISLLNYEVNKKLTFGNMGFATQAAKGRQVKQLFDLYNLDIVIIEGMDEHINNSEISKFLGIYKNYRIVVIDLASKQPGKTTLKLQLNSNNIETLTAREEGESLANFKVKLLNDIRFIFKG